MPYYTLKELSIVIDSWLCLINSIMVKESSMDPTLENQIVQTSEIGPSQPNRSLSIYVIVNNMIIIEFQSHDYLILTFQVTSSKCEMSANGEILKNINHVSHRNIKVSVNNVYL